MEVFPVLLGGDGATRGGDGGFDININTIYAAICRGDGAQVQEQLRRRVDEMLQHFSIGSSSSSSSSNNDVRLGMSFRHRWIHIRPFLKSFFAGHRALVHMSFDVSTTSDFRWLTSTLRTCTSGFLREIRELDISFVHGRIKFHKNNLQDFTNCVVGNHPTLVKLRINYLSFPPEDQELRDKVKNIARYVFSALRTDTSIKSLILKGKDVRTTDITGCLKHNSTLECLEYTEDGDNGDRLCQNIATGLKFNTSLRTLRIRGGDNSLRGENYREDNRNALRGLTVAGLRHFETALRHHNYSLVTLEVAPMSLELERSDKWIATKRSVDEILEANAVVCEYYRQVKETPGFATKNEVPARAWDRIADLHKNSAMKVDFIYSTLRSNPGTWIRRKNFKKQLLGNALVWESVDDHQDMKKRLNEGFDHAIEQAKKHKA